MQLSKITIAATGLLTGMAQAQSSSPGEAIISAIDQVTGLSLLNLEVALNITADNAIDLGGVGNDLPTLVASR